jgi:oxidase EvaA
MARMHGVHIAFCPADPDALEAFTRSASPAHRSLVPDATFADWFADRSAHQTCNVEQVPLSRMDSWYREPDTGNIVHRSGKFFSVEGLHMTGGRTPATDWWQPIIVQPEIGVLGLLAKEFGGVLHFLVQAKTEPGNLNRVEIAPTVQATRSNYTRVHRGAKTRYLQYFTNYKREAALVDVLQSEHGTYFLRKRNRNVIVRTEDDVPLHEDYCWLSLYQLRQLLQRDCIVNMNARTVLSCIAYSTSNALTCPDSDSFRSALLRSVAGDFSLRTMGEILSWFNELKASGEPTVLRVPLSTLPGLDHTNTDEVQVDGASFGVIGVAATINSREVSRWMQPIIRPYGKEVIALVVCRINGVLHLLLRATFEPGLRDVAEMAPTAQFPSCDGLPEPSNVEQPFAGLVQNAPASALRYDATQSEEGGRFFHTLNRYVIVEADEDFPIDVPPDYQWLTLAQASALLRHSYYFTIQCRALIACLQSLW